jgi:hypothetical protein
MKKTSVSCVALLSNGEKFVAVASSFTRELIDKINPSFGEKMDAQFTLTCTPWVELCTEDGGHFNVGEAICATYSGYKQIERFADEHAEEIEQLYEALSTILASAEANNNDGDKLQAASAFLQ